MAIFIIFNHKLPCLKKPSVCDLIDRYGPVMQIIVMWWKKMGAITHPCKLQMGALSCFCFHDTPELYWYRDLRPAENHITSLLLLFLEINPFSKELIISNGGHRRMRLRMKESKRLTGYFLWKWILFTWTSPHTCSAWYIYGFIIFTMPFKISHLLDKNGTAWNLILVCFQLCGKSLWNLFLFQCPFAQS